jgi:hypothetical protein
MTFNPRDGPLYSVRAMGFALAASVGLLAYQTFMQPMHAMIPDADQIISRVKEYFHQEREDSRIIYKNTAEFDAYQARARFRDLESKSQ